MYHMTWGGGVMGLNKFAMLLGRALKCFFAHSLSNWDCNIFCLQFRIIISYFVAMELLPRKITFKMISRGICCLNIQVNKRMLFKYSIKQTGVRRNDGSVRL